MAEQLLLVSDDLGSHPNQGPMPLTNLKVGSVVMLH